MKKAIRIIVTVWIMSLLSFPGIAQQTLSLDKKNSQLTITGTSTLHDWEIAVNQFEGSVTGSFDQGNMAITDSKLTFQVESMESGKSAMDRNVYESMDAKSHPEITFNLSKIEKMNSNSEGYSLTAIGELTISGNTRTVEIPMEGDISNKKLNIKGTKSLKMSSFGIEPPTVMFGTIKTGDKVKIHYTINYQ